MQQATRASSILVNTLPPRETPFYPTGLSTHQQVGKVQIPAAGSQQRTDEDVGTDSKGGWSLGEGPSPRALNLLFTQFHKGKA